MDDDEMKRGAKFNCRLQEEYSQEEMIEALIMNDSAKLDEMRSRGLQLRSAYEKFCEDLDSGDKERRTIAMQTFRRPER